MPMVLATAAYAQDTPGLPVVTPPAESVPVLAEPVPSPDELAFRAYLPTLRQRAVTAGIRPEMIAAVFTDLTLQPRVLELDRSQPGGGATGPISPFAPYRDRHVDAARIGRGRNAWAAQRPRLEAVERATGVPESIAVAIWGHETDYGSNTGGFDLPRALATLAYDGRRRALFEAEFVAALKMLDQGIPRDRLKGSWAGATGGPQFLPSVYLRVARDGDGDGRPDIWTSAADTLASIGGYLADAGWRPNVPWGWAVTVPPTLDRTGLRNRLVSPRCPRVFQRHSAWRTVAEWRALGLAPIERPWPADDVMATLVEPDGEGAPAYLLTGNYRVILDYNCSTNYALSVGVLADAVERPSQAPPATQPSPDAL